MRLMSTAVAALAVAATWRCPPPALRIAGRCGSSATPYKHAGYCFRSTQAIQYFGNGGCYVHNEVRVRFPPHIRRRIDEILRLERVRAARAEPPG